MYLLSATSFLLLLFFQTIPTLRGPVGIVFTVSISVLGAIGLLHWANESATSQAKGFLSIPAIRNQLREFMDFPVAVKIGLVMGAICLPMLVDALMRT